MTKKLEKNYLDAPDATKSTGTEASMKLIYVTISCDIIFERALKSIPFVPRSHPFIERLIFRNSRNFSPWGHEIPLPAQLKDAA